LARLATGPRVTWVADDLLEIDGQRFRIASDWGEWDEVPASTPELFVLLKPQHMLEDYLRRFRRDRPRTIVEVGVYQGGGAAMLWQLCRPETLVGIELAREPAPALVAYKAREQADGMHLHWATNQADVPTILELVQHDLGDRPLDLVVDDASHVYALTRITFETLFPRVRPGGTYVIEDWGWAHWRGAPWQVDGGPFGDEPALSNLIFEIVMATASTPELVAAVEVRHHHAVITRGPAPVGPPVSLTDLYEARGATFKPPV
jgi:hypothetical protein